MRAILALNILLVLAADAAPLAKSRDARNCGVRPRGLQAFDPDITACWHDAVLPAAALGYVPSNEQGTSVPAATWSQLQELSASANGAVRIVLSGILPAPSALAINKKNGITITGPAEVVCTGDRHSAVIIGRSSNIILQNLTFINCTDSAVIVNGTAAGIPQPITTTAAAGRTQPHVLLRGLSIENCSSSSRGGVAVISSRVVLQDSLLQHNVAAGCGGGLYAENSSLLVMNTSFKSNVGNDTSGDASCRGGALHVENSWLAVSHSSFINNSGVNGSAVLVVLPIGMVQLWDTTFISNHPRPGVSREFSSSSGAVTVLGNGTKHVKFVRGPPGSGGACFREPGGLAVVRCTFGNNTAALSGGEGGAISAQDAFLAVINSTITGIPPLATSNTTDTQRTAHDAALQSNGRGRYQNIVMTAFVGGCLSVQASKLLVSGSRFRYCNARFVGGGMSILESTAVIQDTVLSQNYADMGGAIRATDGQVSISNVSVLQNHGLSTGGGMYLESGDVLDVHMEGLNVHHNSLTGRGGGMLAEMVEDLGTMYLSLHNSSFTHNRGAYGGAFCLYSVTAADLQNNHIAHNTALKFGGGMECAQYYGSDHTFASVNNTWLNNTALVRGGGAITHPCNMTSHGELFLANSAAQEGGGFMVYGGTDVRLQNAQVLCNNAQNGAGVMVEVSDGGDLSHLTMSCSSVVANGGASSPVLKSACLSTLLGFANKSYEPTQITLAVVTAAAAIVSSSSVSTGASPNSQPSAVAGAAKGGGLYVSSNQSATIYNSTISGNLASSSGGGIHMEKQSVVGLSGRGGSVSYNNCSGGSGGALFMEEATKVTAVDITWSHNQGMFGGAIFALGSQTSVKLADVTFSNNTAAAGGAVASLGGSSITCTGGCAFIYNRAKVGGALMLHNSSVSVTGSAFRANLAAAASGSAATAAPPAFGAASATIQYMLGEVQVSAGGAAYVWQGNLKLTRCIVISNVAWGAAGRGGGIFVDDSQLSLIDSNLTSNWATAAGGAVLLGPTGMHQLLNVRAGVFSGNGAGLYGGAAAAGLLLPGDAAAAAMQARSSAGSSSSQWVLSFNGTVFVNNTAGRQGGAIACSLCDSLSIQEALLQQNGAAETGGGISCVGCNRLILDNTTLIHNTAASGGGACILAAGKGSLAKDSHFISNAAGAAAAAVSRQRLELATAAATTIAGRAAAVSASIPPLASGVLPTAQQALPACGVVGSGGGLCLGLWDTGFGLPGAGRYLNNSALFGAGLFIEACSQGSKTCTVQLDPNAMIFQHNAVADGIAGYGSGDTAARHLLQADSAGATVGADVLGSGADLYVTNATVLLTVAKNADGMSKTSASDTLTMPGFTTANAVASAGSGYNAALPDLYKQKKQDAAAKTAPSGRHLLSQQQQQQQQHASHQPTATTNTTSSSLPPLTIAEQLAAAVQLPQGKQTGSQLADVVANRVATGPSKLGAIISAGGGQLPRSLVPSSLDSGTVGDNGRLQGLALPVLDQLGGQVADDVAEQLSVQATANFGNCSACQLSGISKVLPVNGTGRFDQLQLLAQPGSNQSITFKLLSALDGVELPGGGQTVRVRLPGCHWGQATTAVGCFNCTSPLFTFSPSIGKCSICPDNVANCSSTTLLPDSGYWNSGPLSTRMHKCPRRVACVRDADALKALQCLQQQQLMFNNPDFITDHISDSIASNSSTTRARVRPPTAWDSLRQQCIPRLQTWAVTAADNSSSKGTNNRHLLQFMAQPNNATSTEPILSPYFISSEVVSAAYEALLCAQGYQGRLCTKCLFPGTASEGPYGHFHTGCGRCPSLTTSLVTYVLSRLFDILLVGLLILTTLLEMKKRRAAVRQARKAVISKAAASMGTTGAASAAASSSQQQVAAASGAGQPLSGHLPLSISSADVSSSSSRITNSRTSGPTAAVDQLTDTAVMWAPGAAALGDSYDDTQMSPVNVGRRRKNKRQRRHQQQHSVGGVLPIQHSPPQSPHQQAVQSMGSIELLQTDHHQQASHQPSSAQQQERQQQHPPIDSWQPPHHALIHSPLDQQQQASAGLAAEGSSGGPFAASKDGPFAAAEADMSGAASAAAPALAAAGGAPVPLRQQHRRRLKRGPLFAREVTSRVGGSVINYSPAQLTTVELFEVFKDFLQVLSILQAVLLGWQAAAAAALSAVSITPLSTTAWISLDCVLPRNDDVALMLPFYQITASLVLPLSYAALLLVVWVLYAASFSLRTHQPFWRLTIGKRLKAPMISSLLVLLSYFYPSLAYTILGVFSCRYLDPSGDSSTVPGEVLGARGWYWTADLDRECFVDPGHRAIALGLGVPGTLLLLAYPLAQGILIAHRATAGQLTPTSDFFADYGHLVEAFRPRLFYWGSIVELRKLVLVAVVLGLASTGVISQLVGCCFVLLGFCAATMGLLPYPYRLLNRLHLGSAGVLLAVVWLNLFVAVGEEGGLLSGGISLNHSLALQFLSVVLVIIMILLLLSLCGVKLFQKVKAYLDVDKDGKISCSDMQALLARLRCRSALGAVLPCFGKK